MKKQFKTPFTHSFFLPKGSAIPDSPVPQGLLSQNIHSQSISDIGSQTSAALTAVMH